MSVRVLDLTTVQWPMDGDQPMFSVVGEQYRLDSVAKALQAQLAQPRSRPHTAILVQQTDNPHDPQAVAVYFRDRDDRHHVGFLPRADARVFREQMSLVGWNTVDLEVLACVTEPEGSAHPQVSIYLPTHFGELCCAGYHLDPAYRPPWLIDSTAIPKKLDGSYTDDELRKIYCRYSQTRKWRSLPDAVDSRVAAWRTQGLGPIGLALKAHEDGGNGALTTPKSEITPVGAVGPAIPSVSHPDVSMSLERSVDLDGVLAWGPRDEWTPCCGIDLSFVQVVSALEGGQTLLAESYFEFRTTNEKGRSSTAIKVPCDQMYAAFTKVWDATLAMRRQVGASGASTRLVSINASKECAVGCSIRPNGVTVGIFRLKKHQLELPDFWQNEFIYLLAKAFRFMQIETGYTPEEWVNRTGHEPHPHGGKITI